MCASVRWKVAREEFEAGTQEQLVDWLLDGDAEKLVFHNPILPLKATYQPECCLCPIKLEETLEGAGYRVRPGSLPGEVTIW